MFRAVLEKELVDLLKSTKFVWSFAVCSVLIVLAFFTGARHYNSAVAAHESNLKENLRALEGRTDWYLPQFQIFRPPQPLTVLVSGVSNDAGRTIDVRERGELNARNSFYNEHAIYALFRFMDLEFIFKWILPLFAMLLGYDAVNGEKERGTLRLAFSNPVPRAVFIAGKMAGSYLALVIPLLIPVLLGCLIWVVSGIQLSAGEWVKLGLIITGGMLYFGVFLAASLVISTLTHRSSSSFIGLLAAWVLMVAFIPAAAVMIAGRLVPVPSADEIGLEKSRMATQLWAETRQQMADYTSKPQPGANPQDMMRDFQQFMAKSGEERQKKQDAFNERQNERRRVAELRREKQALLLARITPATSFTLLADEIAGTSVAMRDHFTTQARTFQELYARFLKEKRGDDGVASGGFRMVIRTDDGSAEAPKPINTAEIPVFQFFEPDVRGSIGRALPDIALLALWNLALVTIASVSFMRYDVR
jgi:ABC-type transport system involved in multi-copper enzyme maturation permease subunit